MYYHKRVGILFLSTICYLLTLTSTALGNPQSQSDNPVSMPDSDAVSKVETHTISTEDGLEQLNAAGSDLRVDTKPQADPMTHPTPKTSLMTRILSNTKGLVIRALSWLGTSYKWGGSSKKGVDCSGLTQLLYMQEGIKLPHSAKLQYKLGRKVDSGALVPGDLVFFNTRGPITHVGMYIGNGKFIHAANPKRGVRMDSLSAPYYQNRFAGARRYMNFS